MNSISDKFSAASEPSKRSLGLILVDAGQLTPEAGERAHQFQQERGLRFGDAAVQLGLTTEKAVQQALASQFGYAYLPASDTSISSDVIAAFQPFNSQTEQLRALRSQLVARWFNAGSDIQPQGAQKTLAIVSADAGDGRSFVAANLAVVFAQLGQRTLLIDANLRNPVQHDLFRLAKGVGLSSVLAGRAPLAEAIVAVRGIPGLAVLPAGAEPPNPQELLGREGFQGLLQALADDYDVILLDTSAAAESSDAQTVATWAKGALVIAKQHHSSVLGLRKLVTGLSQTGIKVVGTLLNQNP